MRLAWPPPWNLIASVLISLLALALANLSPESVQETSSLLALCLVILVPGYLTVLFLFPGFSDIDLYKRIFLCLGFSAILAGLVSLVLWLTPRGLHPASLATILSLLAIFLAAISYIRGPTPSRKRGFVSRSRSKKSLRSTKSFPSMLGASIRDKRKALLLTLVAVCIIGAIALAVSMNLVSSSEGSTTLEVSWPKEALESQNAPLETGRELVVQARIINHEEGSANYTLKLVLNNSALDVRNLNVGQNETWQGRLGFMLVGGPGQQRLDLQLFKEGDYSKPYREEHIGINITENIPQNYSGESALQTDTANFTETNATEENPPAIMEETSKVTVLSASGPGSISASSSAPGEQSSQSSSQTAGQSQSIVPSAKESISSSSVPASTSSTGKAFAKPESETTSAENIAATPAIQSAVEKPLPNPGAKINNSTNESTESPSLPAPNKEKNATPPEGSISSISSSSALSALSNATSFLKTASPSTESAPVSSEESMQSVGPSSQDTSPKTAPEATPSAQSIASPESTGSPQSTAILNSNLPPKLEGLKADKSNPLQGSTVQWTANASDPDGDELYYRFLEDGSAVTDWSQSDSWIWNTSSSAPGDRRITVLARDAKHAAEDSFDDSMNATITIMANNQPPVLKSLQSDKPSPQEKGAIVLWKASALDPDNDKILYKFFLNGREAKKWSKSNSWSWPTENLAAGDYQITVMARDGKHAPEGSFDSFTDATFSIADPKIMDLKDPNHIPMLNDLKPDANSPQVRGAVITWTARATDPDGDLVYYKFLANDNEVADWSISNSWAWNTSAALPGDYKIRVLARDGLHASAASFDSEREMAFTLTSSDQIQIAPSNWKPLVQELKPDVISPQTIGAAITWTAIAIDPDEDQIYYKFLVNDNMVTEWSLSNSWKWNTSAYLSGDYKIRVLARDGFHESEDSFDSSREATFALQATNQPPILNSLNSDRSSPQVQGAVVLWKAEAQDFDGDPILYKFQVNGRDMGRWSESGSWSWSTRNLAAGNYMIRVLARDGRHAPEDSFDSSKDATFALTTEIDQQIDQLMNQRGMGTSGEKSYLSSDIKLAIANGTNTKSLDQ